MAHAGLSKMTYKLGRNRGVHSYAAVACSPHSALGAFPGTQTSSVAIAESFTCLQSHGEDEKDGSRRLDVQLRRWQPMLPRLTRRRR